MTGIRFVCKKSGGRSGGADSGVNRPLTDKLLSHRISTPECSVKARLGVRRETQLEEGE